MSMTIQNLTETVTERMEQAVSAMRDSFNGVRTGKASPALVEGIMVDYYGTSTKLRDIAGITAPEPRLLVIQPWDTSAVKSIEKAIIAADIGISPVSDGRVIRLPIPELSEERRAAMTKQVKARAEEGRVEVRNVRRDANELAKKAEKNSDITEDDLQNLLKEIQDITDAHIEVINGDLEKKSAELMQV
ncbi:MAG: ribosome recycling factor [Lentisphaeria bacterium]|nr:ribosome recycling factor [Lentisphaeria bacterium]